MFKILAKVLASRLRLVIGKVVGPYQHLFVAGRHILDAALVANECVDACLKSNLPIIICKLKHCKGLRSCAVELSHEYS